MHDDRRTAKAYISELLDIPENLEIEAIVALGYPDEKKPAHREEDLLYEKVHYERYGEEPE